MREALSPLTRLLLQLVVGRKNTLQENADRWITTNALQVSPESVKTQHQHQQEQQKERNERHDKKTCVRERVLIISCTVYSTLLYYVHDGRAKVSQVFSECMCTSETLLLLEYGFSIS